MSKVDSLSSVFFIVTGNAFHQNADEAELHFGIHLSSASLKHRLLHERSCLPCLFTYKHKGLKGLAGIRKEIVSLYIAFRLDFLVMKIALIKEIYFEQQKTYQLL